AARRSPDGRYVPLSEQDPALWSRETIAEAEAELAAASSERRPGRFQLEAAIQSAHAARARGGSVDWRAIALFYDHLVRLSPTVGARVGRAAALAEVEGPVAALTRLDEIGDVLASKPYWAVRGRIVSQDEWTKARLALLAKEKALTRQRDELTRERRALPWVKIEKPYVFDGPNGKETLADLFEGRSQLAVYHFMLGPEWEEGCPSCSMLADSVEGMRVHLQQRDTTFVT